MPSISHFIHGGGGMAFEISGLLVAERNADDEGTERMFGCLNDRRVILCRYFFLLPHQWEHVTRAQGNELRVERWVNNHIAFQACPDRAGARAPDVARSGRRPTEQAKTCRVTKSKTTT